MKNGFLMSFLATSVCFFSGVEGALANSRNIESISVNLKANVVGNTCVLDDGGNVDIDVGAVALDDIKQATGNYGHLVKVNKEMQFICDSPGSAFLTISNESLKCSKVTIKDKKFGCSGSNKSIGMIASFEWLDDQKKTIKIYSQTDTASDKLRSLYFDKNGAILKIPEVYFSTLRSIDPTPGDVRSEYVIAIWTQ